MANSANSIVIGKNEKNRREKKTGFLRCCLLHLQEGRRICFDDEGHSKAAPMYYSIYVARAAVIVIAGFLVGVPIQ